MMNSSTPHRFLSAAFGLSVLLASSGVLHAQGTAQTGREPFFAQRDKNKDGKLSNEEFMAFESDKAKGQELFKKFDVTKDGNLNLPEFVSQGKTAQAETTITYNFESGIPVNSWFGYGEGTKVAGSTDATLGKALLFSPGKASFRATAVNFKAVNLLKDGDSLSVKFDFRFTAAPSTKDAGLRLALGNQPTPGATAANPADESFFVTIGTGDASTMGILRATGNLYCGSNVNGVGSGLNPLGINDQTKHTLDYTITRKGPKFAISWSLDGVTNSVTPAAALTTFNTLAIAEGSLAAEFAVDNVVLTISVTP